MSDILSGDFLQTLINAIFELLIVLANIILYPFSLLIAEFFPEVDGALESIAAMFEYASTYVGWAISLMGIPPLILTLMIGYFVFTITVGLAIWSIKVALKWVDTFA